MGCDLGWRGLRTFAAAAQSFFGSWKPLRVVSGRDPALVSKSLVRRRSLEIVGSSKCP